MVRTQEPPPNRTEGDPTYCLQENKLCEVPAHYLTVNCCDVTVSVGDDPTDVRTVRGAACVRGDDASSPCAAHGFSSLVGGVSQLRCFVNDDYVGKEDNACRPRLVEFDFKGYSTASVSGGEGLGLLTPTLAIGA